MMLGFVLIAIVGGFVLWQIGWPGA
ncbi:hypothetical protein I5H06_gp19 [Mycobacterium phage SirPhilip]|uniref:Uncharacterized protein n=1 Tax=Mycobacterium phage SirPhilip TaxID=2015824 RepID=A0A222ZLK1_9CAUD|nr:hypothetical protein I5H06_gp19 [Mycobacterium phage SirPhilip]ASR85285.1 hypothetical protein SEA_SIRPHILIP_83 [Mycobacterium phage SirPhilip]